MGITPFDGKTIAKVDKMFSDMESNLNFKDLDATRFLETNYLDYTGNTSVSNRKRFGIDDSKERFMKLICQDDSDDSDYSKIPTILHLKFNDEEIGKIENRINRQPRVGDASTHQASRLFNLVSQHPTLAHLCEADEVRDGSAMQDQLPPARG